MGEAREPLRILHIGTGFRPMRRGGLIAYVEDLIDEQTRRGDAPAYLFAGRHYPGVSGPRLKRWQHGSVPMLEIVNSPLYDHGRLPELELDEPGIERIVARAIDEIRPDVVHIQEIAGLPSSLIDVARAADVPVVMTVQDYFPLCPAFKLIDANGAVCLRRQVGADCVATVRADARDPAILFDATIGSELERLLPRVSARARGAIAPPLAALATAGIRRSSRAQLNPSSARAAVFQRRRDVNVERLSRLDALIAMSTRVAEIYVELGVDPARVRSMQLTLSHIDSLRPRTISMGTGPVTFATLGGGESVAKGSDVLLGAVRRLRDLADAGRLRVLLFGFPSAEAEREALATPGVEVRGAFGPGALDDILDEVDVGIVPSVWEEAYGYAGMEFLAKGIPVIANAIGGMTDYTRPRETGWLNSSCSADGLADIMRDIVESPAQVEQLNEHLRTHRSSVVMPLDRHAEEMDAVYREVIGARRS